MELPKVEHLLSEIKKGKTLYILHCLGGWKINQKTVEKFIAAGYPVLKEKNGSLYAAKGKKYSCVDFCHIELV
jgi:hypothetical protein